MNNKLNSSQALCLPPVEAVTGLDTTTDDQAQCITARASFVTKRLSCGGCALLLTSHLEAFFVSWKCCFSSPLLAFYHFPIQKKNINMLSRVATTAAKRTAPLVVRQTARSASAVALSGARIAPAAATISAQHVLPIASPSRRSLSTAEDTDHHLAAYAYEKSCYNDMGFTINETESMYNAVQKFSAFKVGSLVVVDGEGALNYREAKAKKDRVVSKVQGADDMYVCA